MAQRKRTWLRSISAFAAVCACVFAPGVCLAQEAAVPDGATEGEYAKTHDPVIEAVQAQYDARPEEPPAPRSMAQPESLLTSGLRAFGALAIIVALILLVGVVAKKYLPQTPVLAGLRLGNVLGRVYLTPKASLHYVKTGGRVLVVGVTPAGIHLLTEFDAETFEASLNVASAPVVNEASGPNFIEFLNAAQKPARNGADEDMANLRGEIQRLSEFLRETSRDPQG